MDRPSKTKPAPALSIITATYNSRACLPTCAESIQKYAGNSYEWTIVDGGSTDGTIDWLKKEGTPVTRWISEPDEGVYDAMNKGVQTAQGRHSLFLGSDDELRPECMAAIDALSDPSTLYYADVWRQSESLRYAGAVSRKKMARTNVCQQSIFYPTPLLKATPFDLTYPIQADWAYNMYCWTNTSLRCEYINTCIVNFEDRQGLSSQKVDHAFNRDYGQLLRKHFSHAECWWPLLLHRLSRIYRSLPGCAEPDSYA